MCFNGVPADGCQPYLLRIVKSIAAASTTVDKLPGFGDALHHDASTLPPSMQHSPSSRRGALTLLLIAAAVFFILTLFPVGRLVLWPFTILTTFVHELGHGLTAIMVGGHFVKMEIFANASGVAYTSTNSSAWRLAMVAAGGLLAPSIVGALFILAGTTSRWSSRCLLVASVIILLSCLVWVRSATGVVSLLAIGMAFLWLARHTELTYSHFLVQFIGVHLLVDTGTRTMRYLFTPSATVGGVTRHSDTGAIASTLGGPYWLWGSVIAVMSFAVIALSLRKAYFK